MLDQQPSTIPVKSRSLGPCLICNSSAVGINFGVPTCAPCKAFFRRNAVKKAGFVCRLNDDCPVLHEFRRMCNCCRLAKCFRVGMQKCLILSDAEKLARKEVVEQNRQKRTKVEIIKKSPVIQPATISYTIEKRTKVLSAFDQTLLGNIFNAYERVYARADSGQYSSFPSIEHTTMHIFYNESEIRNRSLVEYFKLIPEFNRLTINDRTTSIRNHFGGLFSLNEAILARSINQKLVVSVKNLFGLKICNDILLSMERIHAYTRDPIILKLILIIWSLSMAMNTYNDSTSGDHIYDDTLSLFSSQSIYVELLWRYVESLLPSTKYVVKFFNTFIRDFLYIQTCCFTVNGYMQQKEDEINKMEPLMQSIWPVSKKTDVISDDDDDDIDELLSGE
ncbi:unnamed protein product [Adineta steineri]|uniref:Nuclear receptor domain-containing protein n=1 Tax=Adineta steineri TaxID=433720 RepID=A0A813TCQ5_9BILA|nr:unnamed protein product [Adineta steineri]CAF0929419.1 unnamed protein product [Adineta steineri]